MRPKLKRIGIEIAAGSVFAAFTILFAGGVVICARNISTIVEGMDKSQEK